MGNLQKLNTASMYPKSNELEYATIPCRMAICVPLQEVYRSRLGGARLRKKNQTATSVNFTSPYLSRVMRVSESPCSVRITLPMNE